MDQQDIEYFDSRFNRLEDKLDKRVEDLENRVSTNEKTLERHTQYFKGASAVATLGFGAWLKHYFKL